MRVLLITTTFPPDHTGAGKLALECAARLKQGKGVKTDILKVRGRKDSRREYEISGINVGGICLRFSPRKLQLPFHIIEAGWKLRKFLSKHWEEYDVVHGLTVTWFTLIAMWLSSKYKLPTVLESTLLGDVIPPKQGLPSFIYRVKEKLKKPMYDSIDAFKVYSPALKDEIVKINCGDKTHIIPAAVDISVFRPAVLNEKVMLRDRLRLRKDKKYILFVGRVCRRKGVDLLVEAFQKALKESNDNDINLLLVGPLGNSDANWDRDVFRKIDSLNLRHRIFLTKRKVENVHEYMKATDIFVLPSEYEGFGAVTVEAMACGLPTVVTNIEGVTAYQIKDGEDGYIAYDRTSKELSRKIMLALKEADDPESAIKKAAREKACSFFSSDKIASKLFNLYRDLLLPSRVIEKDDKSYKCRKTVI